MPGLVEGRHRIAPGMRRNIDAIDAWHVSAKQFRLAIDHRTEAVALAPPEQLLAPMLPALLTP
ncbi:hypothetical protein AE929_10520 [Xanthomonas arboricola]|nr:hypothetical protein AE929_10520 [Xanthomonas arboricola]OAH85702.1 hypothetical protein AXA70_19125 [Xanthomonas arboricola pv. juglandis]PPU62662.1 hypothetical protein XacyCFBP1159_04490 [Xanthomonas arboricola pv. corylina]KOB50330.1 hypothetical protein AE932_07195 [Xanthomonas arboricola]PMR88617.1 hypothetical protein C1H21_05625 [Xanthomonas arboricola pv. juglandis]